MIDKPTPTGAELKAMWQLHAADIGGILDFARAVLAKWGQPAQAAEPVARLVIGKTKGGVSLTHMVVPAAYQLQEGTYALYTAPHPVALEPVAWKHDCAALLTNDVELWIDACPHCGKPRNAPQPVEREPLTDTQIKGLIEDGVFFGNCKEIVRAIEAAHGLRHQRRKP